MDYESTCDCEECGEFDVCKDCELQFCICICYNYSEGVGMLRFLTENNLDKKFWEYKLQCIPRPNQDGIFNLNLEFIGDDHEVDSSNKQELIQWMKLTQKLLG